MVEEEQCNPVAAVILSFSNEAMNDVFFARLSAEW
jgi:hypothetical protein